MQRHASQELDYTSTNIVPSCKWPSFVDISVATDQQTQLLFLLQVWPRRLADEPKEQLGIWLSEIWMRYWFMIYRMGEMR